MRRRLVMWVLVIALYLLLPCLGVAQAGANSSKVLQDTLSTNQPRISDIVLRLTTPVEVKFRDHRDENGSGFFFNVYAPDEKPATGPHWVKVNKTFLVTALHLVQPEDSKAVVTRVDFGMRRSGKPVQWESISIPGAELRKRLHVSKDPKVDVAALDITDMISKIFQQGVEPNWAVSHQDLPGVSQLSIEAGDDVIVVGYPRGFYDDYNKLPILKGGLLNTPFGLKYDGQDAFLIDFRRSRRFFWQHRNKQTDKFYCQ